MKAIDISMGDEVVKTEVGNRALIATAGELRP
jgi:hypothetical protein